MYHIVSNSMQDLEGTEPIIESVSSQLIAPAQKPMADTAEAKLP